MSLRDVLIDELRDLYSAENQQLKAMPKAAKGSSSAELKSAIQQHIEETKGQVERLKSVFGLLGKKPTGKHCSGMEGAIDEVKEALEEDEEGALKDAGLIGALLRVEHYEIAGYTIAAALAKQIGEKEIVAHLNETLKEEQNAGKTVLTASKQVFKDAEQEEDPAETEEESKPKTAKEKKSEVESEQDEQEAAPVLAQKPAGKSSTRKK